MYLILAGKLVYGHKHHLLVGARLWRPEGVRDTILVLSDTVVEKGDLQTK